MKRLANRITHLGTWFFVSFAICIFSQPGAAVEFDFTVEPGTSQQAIDGFIAAGERWSEVLADDITVNITIAFGDIPSSTGATILLSLIHI